jgi:hypothetical protein
MKKIEKWGTKSLEILAEEYWNNVKKDIYTNLFKLICNDEKYLNIILPLILSCEDYMVNGNKQIDLKENDLVCRIESSNSISFICTAFDKICININGNNNSSINLRNFVTVFYNRININKYKKEKKYNDKSLVVNDLQKAITSYLYFIKKHFPADLNLIVELFLNYILDSLIKCLYGENNTKLSYKYFLVNAKKIITSNILIISDNIAHYGYNLKNVEIANIQGVFSYNETNRKKLTKLLYDNKPSLLACPYCNTNYISVMPNEDNETKFFFELDHFYDKGTYPYLALSFYNLIPSCRTCNSTAVKGSKNFFETPHLHPYAHDFDSIARFSLPLTKENLQQFLVPNSSIKVENTDTEAQKEAKKLKIKIKSAKKASKEDFERAENNVKDFLLEERYELHQDYINEILIKAYAYPDDYLETIQKTFPKLFEGAGSTEQMKRLIWGNYTQPEDINRRPLAKLTQDIMDELGLHKILKTNSLDTTQREG